MSTAEGRKTLQPVAAVGGVFDDGVRLHEVCIDGADKALTARGEALELLRRIEAVERVSVLEVELHHGVHGQAKTDAERGGGNGRRPRLTRGATGVSALSNSQNDAKLLTRIILRVVLLPRNEGEPACGIAACGLPL